MPEAIVTAVREVPVSAGGRNAARLCAKQYEPHDTP